MDPHTQTIFAWAWLLMGLLSGVVLGMGFHKAGFMGGYDSWRRRLARLGHIAFFGTGLLNLFAALTWRSFDLEAAWMVPAAWLLVVGAVSMPTVCFLCAWYKPLRHLFPIPVLTLVGGTGLMFVALLFGHPLPLRERAGGEGGAFSRPRPAPEVFCLHEARPSPQPSPWEGEGADPNDPGDTP